MNHLRQLHDAAHLYLQRGWSVIPVNGKTPAISQWKPFQASLPGSDHLRRWFSNGRATGVALICGPVSGGLTIRDFDQRTSYEAWSRVFPQLAKILPTVETARGYHVYCRSNLDSLRVFDDGELRAKGYCLAPPSQHPSGHVYQWHVPLTDGELPEIDPADYGLADSVGETERTEDYRKTTERTEVISWCSGDSAFSGIESEIEQTIASTSTQPTNEGQRNRMLFELARALKAIPALADAPVQNLRGIVLRWHRRAEHIIGTKPFEDSWADFIRGWPKVRFPKGQSPMAQILARADATENPAITQQYESQVTWRLIRLCRELQTAAGTGPFFLACRTVAELLGIDHITAWRRLTVLETDGILCAVERGRKNRATRYRYMAIDK